MTEIIPKETRKIPSLLVYLFYFSLVLLIILIIVYFRINGSIKKNQQILDSLNSDLLFLQSSENLDLEKKVLGYEKKISDFKSLVDAHKINSKAFKFLEDSVHPDISFGSFDFQSEDSKVAVTGTAKTFEALGQQIIIFQREERMQNLVLERISIGQKGEIGFNISFSLNLQALQ